MLKTIKEYAAERGISTQAVPQLKKLTIVELPLFAEYNGKKIPTDATRKFVVDCNKNDTDKNN